MRCNVKWVQLAKQVAAGTALDDEVCSFSLKFAVLEKLPPDFVATAYENAANAYRAISGSSNTERRQRVKSIYIAEKRKVLSALANSLKQKDVSADVAEGLMLQLPASASELVPTPVPAPTASQPTLADRSLGGMSLLLEPWKEKRFNIGVHQSARGLKRRKLNAVDVELHDKDIDTFLAQIVVIPKMCWMSLPYLFSFGEDAMHHAGSSFGFSVIDISHVF